MPTSRLSASAVLLPLLLVAGCGGSGSSGPQSNPGAGDAPLETRWFRSDGTLLVALVPERAVDLNGDGDLLDDVLLLQTLSTGARKVLPYAVSTFELGGGLVSFLVPENAQGATDLNGDGDASDQVLFVHDPARGVTTDLGLAAAQVALAQEGARVAFVASEVGQSEDLDGDGRISHDVVHLYDGRSALLTSLGLSSDLVPLVTGGRVLVGVSEAEAGDRNGDGDEADHVLAVHDPDTGVTRNLGRAVRRLGDRMDAHAEGSLLAFSILEPEQGQQDLNGDGDAFDELVEMRDLDSGLVRLSAHSVAQSLVGGGLVVLYELEDDQTGRPRDLNGDGDVADVVLAVWDPLGDVLTQTGLALAWPSGEHPTLPPQPALGERRLLIVADEVNQGHADLNGDFDAEDIVPTLFDARSGRALPIARTAGWGYEMLGLDPDQAVYPVGGDADENDRQAHVFDLRVGADRPLGMAVTRMLLQNDRAILVVPERYQQEDLNGDGDLEDQVLVLRNLVTSATQNTKLCLRGSPPWEPLVVRGDTLLVTVSEVLQPFDLNGDGDTLDEVLQIVPLR